MGNRSSGELQGIRDWISISIQFRIWSRSRQLHRVNLSFDVSDSRHFACVHTVHLRKRFTLISEFELCCADCDVRAGVSRDRLTLIWLVVYPRVDSPAGEAYFEFGLLLIACCDANDFGYLHDWPCELSADHLRLIARVRIYSESS